MKLSTLCESLNRTQLDRIVTSVKSMLSEKTFAKAIWHEMNRFGYTGSEIFKQIASEMRRRSSSRNSGRKWIDPYKQRVRSAAKHAQSEYEQALAGSPNVDAVDQFDFVNQAAEAFGVIPSDVIGAMNDAS